MTSTADRMTAAYFDAFEALVAVTPKGWHTERGTARGSLTHCGVPLLNVAYDMTPEPDLGSLDEVATEVGRQGARWSIMVRRGVGDEVVDLAARHGLVERQEVPILGCAVDDLVFRASAAQRELVHHVGAARSDLYTEILAQGFETPESVFGPLMGGGVLDAASMTGYLADDGQPVGTGFGIRTPDAIGVYNIAVVPSARGRGLGRALTEAALRDGVAAGARWAFLLPSVMGQPLYESMGFRLVDNWTMFTAR
ncbi:GNAT family N-acetyltransferase [Micromonospora sp. WMMD710]|uniref:GNAT family N-acetyltransferase n=1 Tax=Micromonospora sp. WMMD710 TaxID=3016085 RepID=UPI002417BE31|nr:GNAT family N-acetyltransferase [Micromonospora sp. WMMD710]MDG4759128.1 GNAT family N-acetyltransferase [Micromonospora sp. WMMD710]